MNEIKNAKSLSDGVKGRHKEVAAFTTELMTENLDTETNRR